MDCQNNTAKYRREVLIRVAKALLNNELETTVDKIPVRMKPKDAENMRCCVYRDRAVLRLRTLAALGLSVEEDENDETSLGEFATRALKRTEPQGPVMTVLDIACKGCVKSRYFVTDACQGCVARPCAVNCPAEAITFKDGRSVIDPHKCIDCGKCREVCPYSAITKVPVPCEEACPVGAIQKNGVGRAAIDFDKCISCGRCMRNCPFGAVMEKSQIIDVLQKIKEGKNVVAMLAPAIAGQFPGELEQIAHAFYELGFSRVVEVASGADITTLKEAEELEERLEHGAKLMTTSCCPAYIETVRRHVPELEPFVSETRTPMHYTAEMMKEEDPDQITVFVGPCVAKRKEGFDDEFVDNVLTFEEAGALFVAADIEVCLLEGRDMENPPSAQGRGFPVTGGVAAAVQSITGDEVKVKPICINGLCGKAVKQLKTYAKGAPCPGNLIEVMACEGGCIGGAGVIARQNFSKRAVEKVCAQSSNLPAPAEKCR